MTTSQTSFSIRMLVLFLLATPLGALGQTPATIPDLNSAQRALVEQLVLDRAAAIVAVQKKAEATLWAELTARDEKLRSEIRAGADVRAKLEEVTRERRLLLERLAARDRQFAAEIEEYRKQMASIANSPDPRRRAALERYAGGDRDGGFTALVEIEWAKTKAAAAGWREIGARALDRMDRGEMTTAEVVPIYELAQRLDPKHFWG